MHTDLNINFKDIDCYQKLLNDTFCLSVKIKSETKILYTALIPNSSEPTEEILQQMSSDSQNLYDNLYKLMDNFESSPYECSATHVLGHYIKAYYLAEAGVDLVKNMTLL